ncbi:MAG: RrF2 family transcriptional regulator [Bacteroidota bacterium]
MKMDREKWSTEKSKHEVFERLVQEIEKSNLRQENVKSETGINHARMLLSKSCVYGLRAALFLSAGEQGQYIPIRNMSEKLDISFHFLTKILQQLTAEGLLESYKGPNGGVRLTRGSDEVSLLDIVRAIDGDAMFKECALGLPGCGHMTPCPMHDKWTVTREQIRDMLEGTTLKELSSRGKEFNLRINATGGFEGFS